MSIGLGMKPVMVVTTSGTAAVNLASAMAEADLMDLPLFAVTADRPKEWIGQNDNQAIVQTDLFHPFVRYFGELIQFKNGEYASFNAQKIAEAWMASQTPRRGPVHLNVPISEPFYLPLEEPIALPKASKIFINPTEIPLANNTRLDLMGKKILVVAGQGLEYDRAVFAAWQALPQAFVFSERLGNLNLLENWSSEAACLDLMENEAKAAEVVIYLGGPIVSKRLKQFLRESSAEFWTIGTTFFPKTYEKIDRYFVGDGNAWMKALLPEPIASDFNASWQRKTEVSEVDLSWSERSIYAKILPFLTADWIHWGNSGVIRYANRIPFSGRKEWANRGCSGIDGSVSTAVGTASLGFSVDLVVGDVSFGYNSNGLWQRSSNIPLRIWVINNGGGKIFSSLDGPNRFPEALEYQETPHPFSIQKIAEAFGAQYHRISSEEEWNRFSQSFNFSNRTGTEVIEVVV
jgi:2-succinyl-5-enolpyruvyl-6-hydroxy-3-cyclohexene-1-carboxylate synthase